MPIPMSYCFASINPLPLSVRSQSDWFCVFFCVSTNFSNSNKNKRLFFCTAFNVTNDTRQNYKQLLLIIAIVHSSIFHYIIANKSGESHIIRFLWHTIHKLRAKYTNINNNKKGISNWSNKIKPQISTCTKKKILMHDKPKVGELFSQHKLQSYGCICVLDFVCECLYWVLSLLYCWHSEKSLSHKKRQNDRENKSMWINEI